jgi:membrane-bound lytic murein transglycosylase D
MRRLSSALALTVALVIACTATGPRTSTEEESFFRVAGVKKYPAIEVPEQALRPPPEPAFEISEPPPPDLAPAAVRQVKKVKKAPRPQFPVVLNKYVAYKLKQYTGDGRERFQRALDRAACYLPLTKEIFRTYGLPEELSYLALIESGYRSHAYSRSHAAGPWQFILATGRRYGLKRDWWVDERRDPVKSAHAAAMYLKELHEEFGDWYLTLAAYNAGEGKVRAAVSRYGTADFWELRRMRFFRRETKNYVPKFLAALHIAKDPAKHGFREPCPLKPFEFDEVTLNGTWDLRVVAKRVGAELSEIRFLNPELRGLLTPPRKNGYGLRLPLGKKESFLEARAGGPLAGMVVRHHVEKGDSLYTIARLYGANLRDVVAVNNLNPRRPIHPRQVVLVPVGPHRTKRRPKLPASGPVHLVEMGDTLWTIAQRYGTTVARLCRLNDMHPRERIHPGDRIILPQAGASRYLVKSGDTLIGIAERHSVALKDLIMWNNLSPEKTLKPGTTLKLKPTGPPQDS